MDSTTSTDIAPMPNGASGSSEVTVSPSQVSAQLDLGEPGRGSGPSIVCSETTTSCTDGTVATTLAVSTANATTADAMATVPMSVSNLVIQHLAADEAELRTELREFQRGDQVRQELLVVALEVLHQFYERNVALTATNRRQSTTIREYIAGPKRSDGGR